MHRQLMESFPSALPDGAWTGAWRRLGALALIVSACALGAPAVRAAADAGESARLLGSVRQELAALREVKAEGLDDAGALALRNRALAAQAQADSAAAALAPELAAVQARLAELGTPAEGALEAADVAAQRVELGRAVAGLDSQVKIARLLAVEAGQVAATASAQRRQQFGARLGERMTAPLAPAFWEELRQALPGDLRDAARTLAPLRAGCAAVSGWTWAALAGALVAAVLLLPWLQRGFVKYCVMRLPAGRLRRSVHAVWTVALWTLTPGLLAHAAAVALGSASVPGPEVARLLAVFEAAAWFGGFVAGLGTALLMPERPSWRVAALPDADAARLRWLPLVFAAAIALALISSQAADAIDASRITTLALRALGALTLVLTLMAALLQLRRARRAAGAHPDMPAAAALWVPTLRAALWAVLLGALLALATGHVAFASFVISQLAWGVIVLGTAYLLAVLTDDLFMALLAPTVQPAPDAHAEAADAAPQPRTRAHIAVLLSGLCRAVIGLFALVLLMAPYGEGPMDLLRRAGRVDSGLSIGEVHLRPATLLQAVAVLLVGLLAVHLLKAWLAKRYMPTTRMDVGMRASVTTLVGYAGIVVVVALAMSAAGIGLERVAWVASALSVGIGFGLQSVVQNFVSGLILLAERPVKVGDWISLGSVEGDIRRINVRATEVQMTDRSIVIVPNSELITKIVRNVTYTELPGLVQIKLPMPLTTDSRKARALLLQALLEHPGVLSTPAPTVHLEGIDAGNLMFNASGCVGSPRAAYGVRSELLFDMLERLRQADLPLSKPATMLLAPAPQAAQAPGVPSAAADGTPDRTD